MLLNTGRITNVPNKRVADRKKAGLTRKFKKFWSGPYKVIRKISELNYVIVSQDNRKQIVYINRLK